MALRRYKENNQLFNTNFLESSSSKSLFGYRGELVLVEGEVADAKGHAKPQVGCGLPHRSNPPQRTDLQSAGSPVFSSQIFQISPLVVFATKVVR